MNYKKAGWAYLCTVIYSLAMAILLGAIMPGTAGVNFALSTVIDELLLMLPSLAFALLSGDRMDMLVPLKRVKLSTLGYTVLYTILLLPLIITINSISMLFVDNAVAGVSKEMLQLPMVVMIAVVGVLAPFVEECMFRGFFLHSYKTSGRVLFSMILSSILFGFIHMNFNQASYTIVIGFMFAMLVEATGSLWPAIICHALFNTENIVTLYLSNMVGNSSANLLEEMTDEAYRNYLVTSIASEAIAAVVCTYFAIRMVKFIAANENRSEYFLSIFRIRNKKTDAVKASVEEHNDEKPIETVGTQEQTSEANITIKSPQKKPNLITIPLIIALLLILLLMITSV